MLSGAQLKAPWWLLSSLYVVWTFCDLSEKSARFWGRAGEMLQVLLSFCHSQEKSQLWSWLSLVQLCGFGCALGWAVITVPKAGLRAALRLSWAVNPIVGHF